MSLIDLNIKEALEMLKKKEISSVELVEAHIQRSIECANLNAYTVLTDDLARKSAQAADDRYKKGEALALDGIPIGVKDLYCTKGYESASCSNILAGFKPEYESTVTEKLFASGGIMIGKTGMDEFAMGSANLTSAKGSVISPWRRKSDDKDIVPGGSSGGSSASVAAKMCMASLGSDTGGSIRQPAAFTGIVGVKPTYGRCSRFGMIAFSSSLDQAGCFARTVEDSALVLQHISGYDAKDATSFNAEVPHYAKDIGVGVKGLRIGIPKEYTVDGMPEEISKMWKEGAKWLQEQGAEIVEISLPHTKYALPTYYIIAPAEASSNLSRYDGVKYGNRVTPHGAGINEMYEATRTKGFGDEVKRRIMIGTYVLSAGYYDAYYTKAQKVRRLVAQDFDNAFDKVDVILTPTAPSEAFAIGENMGDPVKMYLNDVFTVPASLAGVPGISVPTGLTHNGLPLGLQILADKFEEVLMFRVAAALEGAAGFKGL